MSDFTMDEIQFGVCPECLNAGEWLNIGRAHWKACHWHRVKWCFGENLASSWKLENDEKWAANRSLIADYEEVEPFRFIMQDGSIA